MPSMALYLLRVYPQTPSPASYVDTVSLPSPANHTRPGRARLRGPRPQLPGPQGFEPGPCTSLLAPPLGEKENMGSSLGRDLKY